MRAAKWLCYLHFQEDKKYSMNRFERQIILSGFGEVAQQKLKQTKVLVVGAGGF